MYTKLSYDLSNDTPIPAGLPPVRIEQISDIELGDVSNLFKLQVCNHCGTHIDGPWHFNPRGKKISDFPIEYFFFDRPMIVDIPKGDSELVMAEDLTPFQSQLGNCDLLLLRTGFAQHRAHNRQRYISNNPGLSVEVARYLTAQFPNIRALAIDTISIAANEHLDEGLEAHRIFFRSIEHPVLLIEDVNLPFELEKPSK